MDFRTFLIEKISTNGNEADIILHQLIENLDDSHMDYSDDRLDFNVGLVIKRSSYFNLFVTIFKSDNNNIKVAKNLKKDGFSIVINTTKYPERMKIDTFLSSKAMYSSMKNILMEYIENYHEETEHEFKTDYEEVKEINNKETFEKVYNTVVEKMKERIEEYKAVSADLTKEMEETAHEMQRQKLVRSLEQLKDEYLGNTFKKFKRIANDLADIDLTRFDKEYKKKYDTRMENFYEYVTKL